MFYYTLSGRVINIFQGRVHTYHLKKKDSVLLLSLVINIGAEFLGMKHERMLKIFLKTFEGRVSEI